MGYNVKHACACVLKIRERLGFYHAVGVHVLWGVRERLDLSFEWLGVFTISSSSGALCDQVSLGENLEDDVAKDLCILADLYDLGGCICDLGCMMWHGILNALGVFMRLTRDMIWLSSYVNGWGLHAAWGYGLAFQELLLQKLVF